MSAINVVNGNASVSSNYPEAKESSVKSFGQKVASVFVPHYELSNHIQSIKGKVQKNPAYALNQEEVNQLKLAFMQSSRSFGGKLLRGLAELPANEIHKVIQACLQEQEDEKRLHPIIERFLHLLNLDELKTMTGLSNNKIQETIQMQGLLKDEAIKNVLGVKGKAIWSELKVEFYYFMHQLIEISISWTGLIDAKESSRRSYGREMGGREAQSKIEGYLAVLGYPSLIFASAFALLESVVVAGIATGVIVVGTLLMIPLYLRYLRPCPREYGGLENLNDKVREKEDAPTYKRRDVLARIQMAFQSGKGVILTADPGVGKTTVVDSLASEIVERKCEKFLLDAQVFSINAGKIETGVSLQELGQTFKRNSKEVVFFLDEIESLFKETVHSGKASEKLLTFHDKFRHIICATTTEQYNRTIKDKENAFNRRFVHIQVKPLEKSEMEVTLYEYLHFKAPELAIEENIVDYIIDRANEYNSKTSQIDAATSLLSAAITRATVLSGGQLEKDIHSLTLEIEALQKTMLHKQPSAGYSKEIHKYQQAVRNLEVKKAEMMQRQKELKKIKELEHRCLALKHSSYTIASQIKDHHSGKTAEWLRAQAYHQILSEFLAKKKLKIGLPPSISKELIDTLIEETNGILNK